MINKSTKTPIVDIQHWVTGANYWEDRLGITKMAESKLTEVANKIQYLLANDSLGAYFTECAVKLRDQFITSYDNTKSQDLYGKISVLPPSLYFGCVKTGDSLTLPVIISNIGTADLEIPSIFLTDPVNFSLTADHVPFTIPPAGYRTVKVTFKPSVSDTNYSAKLKIQSNDSNVDVDLSGSSETTWYKDFDNDGYSDGTISKECLQLLGYKRLSELKGNPINPIYYDTNDTDPNVNPTTDLLLCNITVHAGQTVTYNPTDSITACNFVIEAGANVTFISGKITLKDGFKAYDGSIFSVRKQ